MNFVRHLVKTFWLSDSPPPPASTDHDVHMQPVNIIAKECPRFNSNDPEAMEYLTKYGFVVIKEVANETEIAEAIDLLWIFLESNSPMRRNDPTTWGDESFQKVGLVNNGILAYKGIGQSDFIWKLRLLDQVKEAFSHIYSTNDLITSYDGGSVFRPWHSLVNNSDEDNKEKNGDLGETWKTTCGWFHVDQGKGLRGKQCVQGLVTLTDANASTGGFCVIPNSHLGHDALVDEAGFGDRNYVQVPPSHEVLTHEQILPICKGGDLILWDSRTVHCSTPALEMPTAPVDELLRMVGYVAMVPTSCATPETIAIRESLYATNKTTSHWPQIMSFTPDPDEPIVHDIEGVSAAKRALISGVLP